MSYIKLTEETSNYHVAKQIGLDFNQPVFPHYRKYSVTSNVCPSILHSSIHPSIHPSIHLSTYQYLLYVSQPIYQLNYYLSDNSLSTLTSVLSHVGLPNELIIKNVEERGCGLIHLVQVLMKVTKFSI